MREAVAVLRILWRGGVATLWPWVILAISFGVNLAFYAVADPGIPRQTGGVLSLFATALVANLQAWTRILPFTLGQSGTRRGFLAGLGLFVVAQSVVAGSLLTVLGFIEGATGGWGEGMRFFRTGELDDLDAVSRFTVLACLFLSLSAVGGLVGAVLARWGSTGVWLLSIGTAVLVSAVVIGVVWRVGLADLVSELGSRSWVELGLAYPLLLATLCVAGSWLVVRRSALR